MCTDQMLTMLSLQQLEYSGLQDIAIMPSMSKSFEYGFKGSEDGICHPSSKLFRRMLQETKMKKADLNEDEVDMMYRWIGSELCEEHSCVAQLSQVSQK